MAQRSFSLSAYLALTKGGTRPDTSGWPTPVDPVIWLHVTSPRDARALLGLCDRLVEQIGDIHVVITGLGSQVPRRDTRTQVTLCPVPGETSADISAFLDHWRPALCVWNGPALRPALMLGAQKAGCQTVLLIGQDIPFSVPRLNWLGDIPGKVLETTSHIFCAPDTILARLAKLDLDGVTLKQAGPLVDGPLPPKANERLREELAERLSGRPVWFAAQAREDEVDIILRAHRRAGRYVHRLLLAVLPDAACPVERVTQALGELGLRGAVWTPDSDPQVATDDNLQVVVVARPEDAGLWYRLAPVSFLGGSLVQGHGGIDPFAAVALGSAVLYGPHVGNHLERYSRLVDVGAARIIKDMESLATAVNTVIAPDKSALMAHAGWVTLTASAELADQLVELMADAIDRQDRS